MNFRLSSFSLQMLRPKLIYKNLLTHPASLPSFQHVIIHVTMKEILKNPKWSSRAFLVTELVAAQKSVPIRAKRSIGQWKLKKDAVMGSKVTLRKEKMNQFLDQLVHVILPRDKEFHSLQISSSQSQSFSMGIQDSFLFHQLETQYEKWKKSCGFHLHFSTSAHNHHQLKQLLSLYHFPVSS